MVGQVVLSIRERFLAFGPDQVVQVVGALARCGVDAWVAGGWGVDALLGRQTRRHGDLDLIAAGNLTKARACLEALGFRLVARDIAAGTAFPDRVLFQDSRGRWIDLHPLQDAAIPAANDTFRLAPADVTVGAVAGCPVPCLSAQCQWRLLQEGHPLHESDRHHIEQMREP